MEQIESSCAVKVGRFAVLASFAVGPMQRRTAGCRCFPGWSVLAAQMETRVDLYKLGTPKSNSLLLTCNFCTGI